jgi:hypothetical protein
MLKGSLHIHSTYSDGELTLAELKERFCADGLSFACLTDHAESFDREKLRDYMAECDALSDSQFLFLAGLEYQCDKGLHILGYGVTALAGTTEPESVIRHIADRGGVSVIAHPRDRFFDWIEGFTVLPQGLEAWNYRYDGTRTPHMSVYPLLQRLAVRQPGISAFYGLDLHWARQPRDLNIVLRSSLLRKDHILRALATANYAGLRHGVELPASGPVSPQLLAKLGNSPEHGRLRRWLTSLRRLLSKSRGSGLTND